MIKRIIDLIIAVSAFVALVLPFLLIALLIKLTSRGPVIFWSQRVGLNKSVFYMPKFRSMLADSPIVASGELENPTIHITAVGHFLRRYSIDELPQLYSVIRGHMSIVGPRPLLVSETELHTLRDAVGVYRMRPGITGWAQINGRDHLDLEAKVKLDAEYVRRQSLVFDLIIIWKTVSHVIASKDVSH